MHQQRLQLQIPPRPDYGRWVRHHGVEAACGRLALWLVQGGALWLTSDEKAGKSHFVQALQKEHPHIGLVQAEPLQHAAFKQTEQWVQALSPAACWIVDMAAQGVSRQSGLALFHLMERAREMNRPLLIVWRDGGCSDIPPELMSRLRMLEQVRMEPPRSDADLLAVLRSISEEMQWRVGENILSFLMQELPRDLESQMYALRQLESDSLKLPHRMTQAWAREHLMARQEER